MLNRKACQAGAPSSRADRGERAVAPRSNRLNDAVHIIREETRMNPVVAVIAPGMMGAAVGGRLVEHGLKVLTSLAGRSAETAGARQGRRHDGRQRRGDRGEPISSCRSCRRATRWRWRSDLRRRSPPATASRSIVDCNAVSPPTVERVAAVIAPTGSPFVDAGIIGAPPKPSDAGPRFYASGPHAPRFAALQELRPRRARARRAR